MLIERRNAMMAGGGGWKNPYVTDGLIAMWDGEWNAGPGVHDPNATKWIDLVDNTRWYDLNEYAEWHDSYITKSDHSYAGWIGRINSPLRQADYQKECVVLKYKTFGDRAVFWSVDPNNTSNKWNELVELAVDYWALSGQPVKKPYINIEANTIVSISGYGTSSIYKNAVPSTKMYNNNVGYGRGSLFGGNNSDSGYNSKYGTDGNIYNIRIYNRQLTADEIAANCAVDKARFNLPDAT